MNNKLTFIQQYIELNREYIALRRNAHAAHSLTKQLLIEGFVVVPNYFTEEVADNFINAIPPLNACQLSTEGTFTRFYSNAADIEQLKPFFESDEIYMCMKHVLGPTATMHRSTVQYRTKIGHTGAFEHFYHIDTWRPRYKAFLYLTDVDSENGPFTYTPRSHYGWWRLRYDKEIMQVFRAGSDGYIHDEESAYVGCLWPHEYNRLCKKLDTEPQVVTGRKGTLIIFDARGLHKIQPLIRAPRIILSSYWIRKDQHT